MEIAGFCNCSIERVYRLVIFFVSFYSGLICLFTVCMLSRFYFINLKEPTWKLNSSLIGNNPGLSFQPFKITFARDSLLANTEKADPIQFNESNSKEYEHWIHAINEFLTPYRKSIKEPCNFNQPSDPQNACFVNLSSFGPCTSGNGYGYHEGNPCVFLKLNRVFDWIPKLYDDKNDLPENMPSDLSDHIKSIDIPQRQQVWISCQGHKVIDRKNIFKIELYPTPGFPAYYFPYRNQPGYLSPLVSVYIKSFTKGKLISIECRAWAQNLIYDESSQNRMSSVIFEVMVN